MAPPCGLAWPVRRWNTGCAGLVSQGGESLDLETPPDWPKLANSLLVRGFRTTVPYRRQVSAYQCRAGSARCEARAPSAAYPRTAFRSSAPDPRGLSYRDGLASRFLSLSRSAHCCSARLAAGHLHVSDRVGWPASSCFSGVLRDRESSLSPVTRINVLGARANRRRPPTEMDARATRVGSPSSGLPPH